MTRERVEAKAESNQAVSNCDGLFSEAYSDTGLVGLKPTTSARLETLSLDFSTQNIYGSADRKEPATNELNEAERVTPLAQQQRAERLDAHRDVAQSTALENKANTANRDNLPSSTKDDSVTEPKVNEIAEADRVTPLAQRQRLERLAANSDVDQIHAVKDR